MAIHIWKTFLNSEFHTEDYLFKVTKKKKGHIPMIYTLFFPMLSSLRFVSTHSLILLTSVL